MLPATMARNVILSVLILLLAAVPVLAQDSGDESGTTEDGSDRAEIFAPFVSRIQVRVSEPRVRVNWVDPEDLSDDLSELLVYRHTQPIDEDTLGDATLAGTVAPGVEDYRESIAEPGDYYYAVLARTGDGQVYEILVPFRNATRQAIAIESAASIEEIATDVRGMRASLSEQEVELRFEVTRSQRPLVIYRASSPITSMDDLSAAGVIERMTTSSPGLMVIEDFPVPGVPYYYAVVDEGLVTEGLARFEAGSNATSDPVEIPLGNQRVIRRRPSETVNRNLPLPYLSIASSIATGQAINPAARVPRASSRPLQPDTQAVAERLASAESGEARPEPQPVVLEEDTLSVDKGPAYTLQSIVEGPFATNRWNETQALLENYLTLSLDADVRARAQFYLGQALFFAGDYNRAFMSFLLARESYFPESQAWLDEILIGLTEGS